MILFGKKFCRLAFLFCLALAAFPAPGSDAIPATPSSPYDAAIEEAERELVRTRTTAPEPGGTGWDAAEWLSLAALSVAVILVFFAMRWTRGGLSGMRGGGKQMRILDRMAVGRNNSLLLVRIRDRDYWLSEGQHGVRVLADWPTDEKDSSPSGSDKSGT